MRFASVLFTSVFQVASLVAGNQLKHHFRYLVDRARSDSKLHRTHLGNRNPISSFLGADQKRHTKAWSASRGTQHTHDGSIEERGTRNTPHALDHQHSDRPTTEEHLHHPKAALDREQHDRDKMRFLREGDTAHQLYAVGYHGDKQSVKTYAIDDTVGLGLVFEGVGAISGGGATTKLLYDYPENVSSKILDVLFKPGEGLNLHMLKVEIGGNTDATQGAEPSHMHFDGDENYHRGYEWWLMKEAKKRNRDIKLYGLPWGWPGGLDSKATSQLQAQNVFEQVNKTVDYTLKWLQGAKREHGLDIDYVGLWNEMDAPPAYAAALRDAVMKSDVGERTQVLPRLVHYPGAHNDPDKHGCKQHLRETRVGHNWVDEEGSIYDGRSARCLARVINRNYISMCKTATIQWHLISSFYDYLPWPRCGVAVANEPWSGAFEITSPTWAIAHTTQFAQIGWRYAAHGSGVSMLRKGGSMVTRINPNLTQFSIVLEKMRTATSTCGHGENPPAEVEDEDLVILLKGSFLKAAVAAGRLEVWRSNLESGSEYGVNPPTEELFQHLAPLDIPEDGKIKLTLHREEIITITTVKGGGKIVPSSPPKQSFPLPFAQEFDEERIGKPPRLWYDQMGAWEIQESPYGDADKRGKVMRQVVPVWPNCWGYACEPPTTYFGPAEFKGNLTVSFDIRIEDHGGFTINPLGFNYSPVWMASDGVWFMGNPKHTEGKIDFPADKWHKITMLLFQDGRQKTYLNGEELVGKPVASSLLHVRGNRTTEKTQCPKATFPISTVGKKFLMLKPPSFDANTADLCRAACCMDENYCDVWQFDGHECQIGRATSGYDKDLSHTWVGGTRGALTGWHLKIRLSRYMYTSIDNFQLFDSSQAPPLGDDSFRS